MGLHMFKVYSAGISLHFLKGKKKKKEFKENRGRTLCLSTLLRSVSMPQWDHSSECHRPEQG